MQWDQERQRADEAKAAKLACTGEVSLVVSHLLQKQERLQAP